jgi:ornithine--oxo-acid transaminase
VLTNSTHRNTVRFAPPLIIDESQIDSAVNGFSEVLEEIAGSNAPV